MRDHHKIEMYAQKAGISQPSAYYHEYTDPNKYIMYSQEHYDYKQKLAEVHETRENDTAANAAMVRLFHASPYIREVDIYINGQKVLHRLKYKQISQHLKLPAGQYEFVMYPTGQSHFPILRETLYIFPILRYTVAALGKRNHLQLLPFFDNPYVPYGEAKIRFAYLSTNVSAINIAVQGSDALFQNVRYQDITDYARVPADQRLAVEMRAAETGEVVLAIPNVKFRPNRGYTIVALANTGAMPSIEAVLIEE